MRPRPWLDIAATLLALLAAGCGRAADERDVQLAEILKLEDRRSAGGGALKERLAAGQPLETRVRAALAAGRIGAPAVGAEDLRAALADQQPELRRMAAFALGEMDDPGASAMLAGVLNDPDPQVRALAAEALGKLKGPGAASLLEPLLVDEEEQVAGMALLALWKVIPGDALSPLLVAKASGKYGGSSGELRQRAAYFIMRAQMGHPESAAPELPLLVISQDEDPLIRSFAARGLGASKTLRATEALLKLAADADWRVRVNAFNGLKARPVIGGWDAYEAGLADADAGVALAALAALETCKAPQAAARLREALLHPRARYREVAAVALAAREGKTAAAAIRPLATDSEWSVRARAAEALSLADPEAAAEMAADSDARVRGAAVAAFGEHQSAPGAMAVVRALEDEDAFVRAAALEAMGRTAEAMPEPMRASLASTLAQGYQRALTDADNDARLAALTSLAKLSSDEARAAIEAGLRDPDYLVRRRAAELLRDNFKVDRMSLVGEPRTTLSDSDYLEAAGRARRHVTATLETDAGEIRLDLYPGDAPLTVHNFVRLARAGRLDGLAVHRVVPNFVIQDGDPRGDGNGGPGWQIRCEINLRRYGEGTVGMALSGKDTGGSQYFITHSPQPHLDGGYTVFGQVVAGQESVRRMVQGDAIRRVTIHETEAP